MLAEGSDDPRVAKLTYLLGIQMRYGVVRSEELVTIRQELDHTRNYLDMLQIRFPDKFSLEIEVPDNLLPLPVIKLVFQPIVENAVFHGLEPKEGPGTIRVTGRAEGNQAVFCVEDDGVGMNKHTLHTLNDSLPAERTGSGLALASAM